MAKSNTLTIEEYVSGVKACDRTVLARAITLIESRAAEDIEKSQAVLEALIGHSGKSIRVGVTGVPGVGKSTFIEALGTFLTGKGHRVAVMAVDPSSSVSGGSILGDKTRMEKLSRDPNAFVRPSPSGGTLGGVASKTREIILLCEAAGFDVILVETVGVGQSEISVRSMVDFFLLLMITGAGDELQGIKRGVMEIADALVVNKADGDNKLRAETLRKEFEQVFPYLQPATKGWEARPLACSSMTGEGIEEVWAVIEKFKAVTTESGAFETRRKKQARYWLHEIVDAGLARLFRDHPEVSKMIPEVEESVMDGTIPATTAAKMMLDRFRGL